MGKEGIDLYFRCIRSIQGNVVKNFLNRTMSLIRTEKR